MANPQTAYSREKAVSARRARSCRCLVSKRRTSASGEKNRNCNPESKKNGNSPGPTTLTSTITTYPASGLPWIAEHIETNNKSLLELILIVLPSPLSSEKKRGFPERQDCRSLWGRPGITRCFVGCKSVQSGLDPVEFLFSQGSTPKIIQMAGLPAY